MSRSQRLDAELDRYMTLAERLGRKLEATLDLDVNEAGTPSRDWARCYSNYRQGLLSLVTERRESQRLALAAQAQGTPVLSDAEYEAQLRLLAADAVREMPADELAPVLAERGIVLAVSGGEDE